MNAERIKKGEGFPILKCEKAKIFLSMILVEKIAVKLRICFTVKFPWVAESMNLESLSPEIHS